VPLEDGVEPGEAVQQVVQGSLQYTNITYLVPKTALKELSDPDPHYFVNPDPHHFGNLEPGEAVQQVVQGCLQYPNTAMLSAQCQKNHVEELTCCGSGSA
jgi:hypothetical protein